MKSPEVLTEILLLGGCIASTMFDCIPGPTMFIVWMICLLPYFLAIIDFSCSAPKYHGASSPISDYYTCEKHLQRTIMGVII